MAKRRKFSRWRRLPGVYRFGDEKAPDPNLEPERLTLYVPGVALDAALEQSQRLGFANVQEYCGEVLIKALDAERVREHLNDVESRRGSLEGFHEIADDPEFLADLSAASAPRESSKRPQTRLSDTESSALSIRLERQEPEPRVSHSRPLTLSTAAVAVLRHAGQWDDDPTGFLACLRRGESVPPSEVGELAQALHELEMESRDLPEMDRRLTFALHRLAFESQILHTDAWPGTFDPWTVDMLRAVQEAVERILSGQDIRYYPDADPDPDPLPRPETPR